MDRFKVLTQFDLKMIAVISMLIDHIGMVLFPHQMWLRGIGRLAFPIYCFLLTEGYKYTSSKIKYAIRLAVFAVLSEIPFDLAESDTLFDWSRQNVFITLFFGFLLIWAYDVLFYKNMVLLMGIYIAIALAAYFSKCDYSAGGVLIIFLFYVFGKIKPVQYVSFSVVDIACYESKMQKYAIFALIPITFYNGERGRKLGKWFFYPFYAVHFLVLVAIKHFVMG
ncbi:MAG: conjugal transfer protein TraX [Lachnospiraceae bacterium]|nr:conjugal transfer protein TraX [Lachnospiraceae bacterium]